MKQIHGVSGKIRVLVLLALLVVAPAAMAADSNSDPSWIDLIQNWFETLLGDDQDPPAETDGVIHLPGG